MSQRISLFALSTLLAILNIYHPYLPKDSRTLLKTNIFYNIKNIAGGSYYHFGINSALKTTLDHFYQHKITETILPLQINFDGLPLYKSTNGQFWPILGMLDKPRITRPFVIGLFYGTSKPSSLDEYLDDFVTEMTQLKSEGFLYKDHKYEVQISSIMCDAPARSFIKSVKSHSGYGGCDKCSQHGEHDKGMTFPESNAPLRTDVTFDEMSDKDHHTGVSPLTKLNVGMVSQFPMDYMHLVCLGVMKRLIGLWKKRPFVHSTGN